ncbi:AsmA family protein [Legionella septentrionalis]|uniref:AsmA family protein n=1 Tax=Legionella septentrionalis TaxID=2498109 RepID=UPI000F8F351B|nr:AsmA family protein [Legionella septentrionalis]RUQ99784.1 AsmA family protein [Legionella septentrionalis]RUR11022.1 AsmA family protein [Legionella septentrionalis]
MKLIKKTLISLFFLTTITACALWALTYTITPEEFKDLLNQKLAEFTEQPSHIEGNISWQLFPRPGLKISTVKIGGKQIENNYSLAIDNMLFNLQITPLLRGKLVFNELLMDGVTLNINPETRHTRVLNRAATSKAPNKTLPASFSIENFLLTRGQVVVSHPQNNLAVTDLQIGANQLNFQNKQFPVQLKGNLLLLSNTKESLKANINFKGRTQLTPAFFIEPLNTIQNTATHGQILIQDAQYKRLKIAKINANAILKTGTLRLNPLNLTLYNGESVGDLSFHIASKKFAVNQTATGIKSTPLSKALWGEQLIKGTMDFSIHATGTLPVQNILDHVQASGHIMIRDGALCFVDIHQMVKDIPNTIHSMLTAPKSNETLQKTYEGRTKFKLLSMHYDVKNNPLFNDSFLLQTEEMQINGKGRMNLKDRSIDNELSAKLIQPEPMMDKIQQILNGNLPLKLTGPIMQPLIVPNMQKISPLLTQFFLKQSIDKPLKQLKAEIMSLFT